MARERRSAGEPGRPLKIVLVTQWFDPEPTFKGLLFARELERLGHTVSVVTGFPNYPGGKVYSGYRVRLYQREVVEGITVHRTYLYPSHDGSGLRRAWNYLTFALSAGVAALFIARPDVAYVYHPPATVVLPAEVLRLVRGVPYVYDVQDLWPDTLRATGMVNGSRPLAIVARVMKSTYRRAARLVVLSEGFKAALVARKVPAGKVDVIPNWADEDQIDVRPGADRPDSSGSFRVSFAGTMGAAQALDTVLDAAALLKDTEPSVRFTLIGDGIDAARIRDLVASRTLTNVEVLPRRPLAEIGAVLTASDALLVHLRDDPLFSITIPSKTQAYLMAGRPILMGVRGDAARMVEDANAGIAFAPEDPGALAAAIRQLLAMSPAARGAMGASGRDYYSRHLSLAEGARRFADVLRRASMLKPRTLAATRLADLLASTILLIVLALPIAVVALVVRFGIGGPVLFRQLRPGRDGEPFEMLKFRTMSDARGPDGALLPDGLRLTSVGSALRATSLDELPSLWNVFRGQMALVGPRPLLMRYTKYFTVEEAERLMVRPGITGWAQVNGRNLVGWDERLAMDVWYVRNMSVGLNVKILLSTVLRVFRSDGVVVDPESVLKNLDDDREGRRVERD